MLSAGDNAHPLRDGWGFRHGVTARLPKPAPGCLGAAPGFLVERLHAPCGSGPSAERTHAHELDGACPARIDLVTSSLLTRARKSGGLERGRGLRASRSCAGRAQPSMRAPGGFAPRSAFTQNLVGRSQGATAQATGDTSVRLPSPLPVGRSAQIDDGGRLWANGRRGTSTRILGRLRFARAQYT